MGAALAGSDGWLPSNGKLTEKQIQALLEEDLTVDDLFQTFKGIKSPHTVTIGVHNGCNLSCRHCYWQPQHISEQSLTVREQETLVESVIDIQPKVIVLCGKEVLLGRRGVSLLRHMNNIRHQKKADFRMGIVTNGTLLHEHMRTLEDCNLDYMDISMDGTESQHDALRGKGAFVSTLQNLEWAVEHFDDQLFITLTVSKLNYLKVLSAIKLYKSLGISNICISFYKLLPYTSSDIALNRKDLEQFFVNLTEYEALNPDSLTNLIFDLDILSLEALEVFFESSWFHPAWVNYDNAGEYYIEHYLNRKMRLLFRLSPFPVGIWKVCRITPEGDYLAAEDMLDMGLYPERIISNAREYNFDFKKQHLDALQSTRFSEIMMEYKLKLLPVLQERAFRNIGTISKSSYESLDKEDIEHTTIKY